MLDTLPLQGLTDERRAWVRPHERFAALEETEREEFCQREMCGTLQRLAVLTQEATDGLDQEWIEEEA